MISVEKLNEMRLDQNAVKEPNERAGIKFRYLNGAYVTNLLNTVFGQNWSFVITDQEVETLPSGSVLYKTTGYIEVELWTENNPDAVPFKVRRGDTGSTLARRRIAKVGEAPPSDSQQLMTGKAWDYKTKGFVDAGVYPPDDSQYETAHKGSATDCLKRCAVRLGNVFGLELYYDDEIRAIALEGASSESDTTQGTQEARRTSTTPLDADEAGQYVIRDRFKKGAGKTIAQLAVEDESYLKWLAETSETDGSYTSEANAARAYMNPPQPETVPMETETPVSQPSTPTGSKSESTPAAQTDGDRKVMSATNEQKKKMVDGLREYAVAVGWDDAHLVGHIAKRFNITAQPGQTSVTAAVYAMTLIQVKTMKEVLETIEGLTRIYNGLGLPDGALVMWCVNNLGKSWTATKTDKGAIADLTHEERLKALEYVTDALATFKKGQGGTTSTAAEDLANTF